MLYIFGIGNPNNEYKNTRHNAGRIAGNFLKNKKIFDFTYQYIETGGYMNNSGMYIRDFLDNNNFDFEKSTFVVIYDDKDIKLGNIKNAYNRGHGGHNGIKDIISNVGCDFYRIRVGILGEGKIENISDYVLDQFSEAELNILQSDSIKNKIKDSIILFYKEIQAKKKSIKRK